MRRHLIEQHGLGDTVRAYYLAGLSLSEIASMLEFKCGVRISRASVGRWLTRNAETIAAIRKESASEEFSLTVTEVNRIAIEILSEINSKLPELQSQPLLVAAFLRLKLDTLDRMVRLLGGYPLCPPKEG